jgi:hypothetical protein
MKDVYEYLRDQFTGNDGSPASFLGSAEDITSSTSLLLRGLQLNNFFAHEFNDKDKGISHGRVCAA